MSLLGMGITLKRFIKLSVFSWPTETPTLSSRLAIDTIQQYSTNQVFFLKISLSFSFLFSPPPPFFCLFMAAPAVDGSSQVRSQVGRCSCQPTPQSQQRGIWTASATYITAHGNTGSIIHWARPGIKPATSWTLVRFITHWATMGTPIFYFYFLDLMATRAAYGSF